MDPDEAFFKVIKVVIDQFYVLLCLTFDMGIEEKNA